VTLRVNPVAGIPQVHEGDDLAALIAAAPDELADGDVVATPQWHAVHLHTQARGPKACDEQFIVA
jgi:hypothetical protein